MIFWWVVRQQEVRGRTLALLDDLHLLAARGDIHHPGLQGLAILALDCCYQTFVVEGGGQRPGKGLRHMLHDNHWHGQIGWEIRNNLNEGLWSSSRHPYGHDLNGRLELQRLHAPHNIVGPRQWRVWYGCARLGRHTRLVLRADNALSGYAQVVVRAAVAVHWNCSTRCCSSLPICASPAALL